MRVSTLFLILFVLACAGCAPAAPAAVLAPTSTPGVDEAGGVCSVDPQTTCAAPTSAAEPVLYGTWVREGDADNTLTITAQSVALVEKAADGSLREAAYEILSVDWARDIVTMRLTALSVNGKTAEVPTGLTYMKVWIDNDTFYYALGDEAAGAPSEANIGPFTRE